MSNEQNEKTRPAGRCSNPRNDVPSGDEQIRAKAKPVEKKLVGKDK